MRGRPVRTPRWLAPATVGVAVFLVTLAVPGSPLHDEGFDSPPLQTIGEAVANGAWPYRDVFVEYPPLGMPMVVLPAVLPGLSYGAAFQLLQIVCVLLAVCLSVALLDSLGASRRRLLVTAAAVGTMPLLLGELSLNRFDFWPAALVAAALMLIALERPRTGAALLAVASLAKLYPLSLVPLVALYILRRWDRRVLAASAAAFAAVTAVVVLPILIFAQDGLTNSLLFHRDRPLHIESAAGGVLAAGDVVGAYDARYVFSHGSANVVGGLPDRLAQATLMLSLVGALVVLVLFARGRATPQRLVIASAATIAVTMVFGKVLSPQFAAWLVPVVVAVSHRLAALGIALLGALLVTTQVLYPRVADAWAFETGGVALLNLRNLLLAALAVVLTLALTVWTAGAPSSAPRGWAPDSRTDAADAT